MPAIQFLGMINIFVTVQLLIGVKVETEHINKSNDDAEDEEQTLMMRLHLDASRPFDSVKLVFFGSTRIFIEPIFKDQLANHLNLPNGFHFTVLSIAMMSERYLCSATTR